ncbi:MAG: thioredoxin family protein [Spirochaetaceae bacterium]|nr:thioredoxin family protein [Spirochaetaceae bacterium]
MTLDTNLKHIETAAALEGLITSSENVMVCCGRMGPMCLPVYALMEELEESGEYPNVVFRDMLFDIPDASVIRDLPECASFRGIPFTIYYKNGKVVKATSSIQSKDQVTSILNEIV